MSWSLQMASNGACPECGRGCKRQPRGVVSDDAYVRQVLATIEADYRRKQDKFDAYYFNRPGT